MVIRHYFALHCLFFPIRLCSISTCQLSSTFLPVLPIQLDSFISHQHSLSVGTNFQTTSPTTKSSLCNQYLSWVAADTTRHQHLQHRKFLKQLPPPAKKSQSSISISAIPQHHHHPTHQFIIDMGRGGYNGPQRALSGGRGGGYN